MSMLVRVLGEKGSSATAALETLGTCTMVSVLHFFCASGDSLPGESAAIWTPDSVSPIALQLG